MIDKDKYIWIFYKNHRGVSEWRRVVPLDKIPEYKTTGFHDVPQWFLRCWCLERQDYRDFALLDIIHIKPKDFVPPDHP